MFRLTLLVFAGLIASTSAYADEADSGPNFADETLTGDWNSARSAAARNGFLWEGGLKLDGFRNRGAQSSGAKTVGHLDLKLRMDLDKSAGWTGGSAMVNVISDTGWGPNARHVSGQMGVTNIEVPFPTTTRLFQAWLQQGLFGDRLAVLAGLYPIDSEFFTMDSAGVLLGPQYGTPADLAQTRGPSIFNNSAFGLRARWNIDKSFYAMGAVLDGIPNDPAHPRRTAIRFAKGDGSFSIAEAGWLPEAADDKFKGHAKLALGVWGYSAKVDDLFDVDAGGNPLRRHSTGGYVLGERTLFRLGGEAERFVSGFARYTWSDGNSTVVKDSVNLGAHVRGPVASRPNDIIGVGWTRAGTSGKWRAAQASVGTSTTSSEAALELTYRYAVTPFLAIQPNLQYIRNPSGIAGTPHAKLIGMRIELAL